MRRPFDTSDLLSCAETIEIGQFSWECMGHTPVYPYRRSGRPLGPPRPMNPHQHQSNSAGQPGDIDVTWWTESDDGDES